MRVKMLNLIGCTSLRYAVIRSKPGRIRQFPGLDTPRFKEVSGDQIFLATEKVRIGKNTNPDTRQTRRVSWNMILSNLPVFSKNTGPYRGISGSRHVFFHAVEVLRKNSLLHLSFIVNFYEAKVKKTIFPQDFVYVLRTTRTRHMVSFIDFYFHFLANFQT